jgi:4-amino-4-deoxy-L-arabinose transferase-like glycosyltransferase
MTMPDKGKQIAWTVPAALAIGAAVLLATAALRGAEYDENYTLLLTAGTARPAWPSGVFTVGTARAVFDGHASLASIARDLRATDVHPPLYFWLVAGWRWLVGPSLFAVRLLSVLCGVAALALVGAIARRGRIPPALAILLTVGCYGFAYTGAIARGFAVAQFLSLAGVWLLPLPLREEDGGRGGTGRGSRWVPPSPQPPPARGGGVRCFIAGLSLGAATLANYLAVFVAGAVLLWLLRRPRRWLLATSGFILWLPADLWFYLAQRGSRPGQYPPFSFTGSLPRLAQYAAANLFGGLPLYVDGALRSIVAAGLGLFALLLAALILWRYRHIATPPTRALFALAALAPPVGVLLLGIVLGQTPIELRYLAFATPFAALLLAGAVSSLKLRWRVPLTAAIAIVQIAALLGLMTRQETMQPARATAAAAAALAQGGVVLLPRGNDGVGVVGAFLNEAPKSLRMAIVNATDSASILRARAGDARRVVLALIGVDVSSRATVAALQAAFTDQPCWRRAGDGFNVVAYDRVCEGNGDVLQRLHADDSGGAGR